jgi:two-component system KDP operon response regulator KdpE
MVVRTGGLVVDRGAGSVTLDGRMLQLTRTEHRLLGALAARVGRLCSRQYLLSAVWGDEYVDDTQYLRVYIGYLRAKIEADPRHPRYLLNEWGLGYRLSAMPAYEQELVTAQPAAARLATAS